MRRIQSFLPSNLAGYKSNNSCSASTQYDARNGRLAEDSQTGTLIGELTVKADARIVAVDVCTTAFVFVLLATALLPVHVQGNQNVLVCLEEKQCCVITEQRSQLAHKVLHEYDMNGTQTRRGRLLHGKRVRSSDRFFSPGEPAAGTFEGISTKSTLDVLKSTQGRAPLTAAARSTANAVFREASTLLPCY
jgi:hypothetical protein